MNMNEKKPEKNITVFVNGQEKIVKKGRLSYEEIITLAFDEYIEAEAIAYTVLYFKGESGKPKGELVKGETLKTHEGMVINVTRTDRS